MTAFGSPVAAAGAPSLGRLLGAWRPAPGVLVCCALAGAFYALGIRRRGRRWPARRAVAFALGLVALAVALDSGIEVYADQLASIHMVQHLLIAIVAAPLLAAGAPIRLALGATRGSTRSRLAAALHAAAVRTLTHPLTTWVLFVGLVVSWHLSPLYTLCLRHPLLHDLEHLLLLATALLFWAQVVGSDPLPRRLGAPGRLLYLLAAMPAMSVIGIWLVASHTLRYPAYAAPSYALGISPLHDQHVAGAIMWGGDALLGAITLLIACQALLQEERRAAARDARRVDTRGPIELGGAAR